MQGVGCALSHQVIRTALRGPEGSRTVPSLLVCALLVAVFEFARAPRWGIVITDEKWPVARLIAISSASGVEAQERRLASALLAVMAAVPEFGNALLKPLGAPSGKFENVATIIERTNAFNPNYSRRGPVEHGRVTPGHSSAAYICPDRPGGGC